MPFRYARTIRFADTDAAGVVYFARILSLCHEAYEAALAQAGIDIKVFFSRGPIAVPITHTEANFHRPLMCGDPITIDLQPVQQSAQEFEITYTVQLATGKVAAIASTRHICIDTVTRRPCPLTLPLVQWLQQV